MSARTVVTSQGLADLARKIRDRHLDWNEAEDLLLEDWEVVEDRTESCSNGDDYDDLTPEGRAKLAEVMGDPGHAIVEETSRRRTASKLLRPLRCNMPGESDQPSNNDISELQELWDHTVSMSLNLEAPLQRASRLRQQRKISKKFILEKLGLAEG